MVKLKILWQDFLFIYCDNNKLSLLHFNNKTGYIENYKQFIAYKYKDIYKNIKLIKKKLILEIFLYINDSLNKKVRSYLIKFIYLKK